MTITTEHPVGTDTGDPPPTYLPDHVVVALSLLAVPSSRVPRFPAGSSTGPGPATPEPTGPEPNGQAFAPRSWEQVPRELTDARLAVLVEEMAGRAPRPQDAESWAAEELRLVEAAERVRAWLDVVALGAIRRFREAVSHEVERRADLMDLRSGKRFDEERETDDVAADELALVTGFSDKAVRQRLDLACVTDGRATVLLARLAEGRTTIERCLRIMEATRDLEPEPVRIISNRVLAPTKDGSLASHALFVRRLRRQVVLHQRDSTRRHADAIARRTAFGELHDDGSGTLTITGDGVRVVAALDRIEAIARTLKAGGDRRSLDALRSDIALDLLLVGWPTLPGTAPLRPTPGQASSPMRPDLGHDTAAAARQGDSSSDRPAPPDGHDPDHRHTDHRHTDEHECDASCVDDLGVPDPRELVDLSPWFAVAVAPPASVHVVVSLGCLLGVDETTAEIPGYGFISGDIARQAALSQGSVWRRLVTDPLDGTALELSTTRYRPTAEMARQVAALDGTCRAPGCAVPASRCDIDHLRRWPHGETSVVNLRSAHRRHHNHKTRGLWKARAATSGDGLTIGPSDDGAPPRGRHRETVWDTVADAPTSSPASGTTTRTTGPRRRTRDVGSPRSPLHPSEEPRRTPSTRRATARAVDPKTADRPPTEQIRRRRPVHPPRPAPPTRRGLHPWSGAERPLDELPLADHETSIRDRPAT